MLEARAHQELKALLQREGLPSWPHHLTLSRLVGRSLRRGDQTLVRLLPGSDPSWWVGLLVPLALSGRPVALVVSDELRQRLFRVEWPRLEAAGLNLPCWEGPLPPAAARIWMMDHAELLTAWRSGSLGERQLVIPEAESLETVLRQALAVAILPQHWDRLRRSLPAAGASLLALHSRLSQRILGHPRRPDRLVTLAPEDEAPLRQLLHVLDPLPPPWSEWLACEGAGWSSWARLDPALLQWELHRQPLDPLAQLRELFQGRGTVLVGEMAAGTWSSAPLERNGVGLAPQVAVELGDPPLTDPLPLYVPLRQPLPNSPHFGEHLLDQSRRLVLGQGGLTVVLIDDPVLRRGLTSGLAAEFGSRVTHECTAPESHGVICAGWSWWLEHQRRLPLPSQVVVALLPIASLEDPITAARVAELRRQGRDWFRELLLPDALSRLQRSLAGLRRAGGRLAVLDGRLRGRSWGQHVMAALQPSVPLTRLLPD